MPIYEYHCPSCLKTFDRLQKIDAPRQINCIYCDSTKASRLVSSPSFRLKGQGWYETDFKTSNRRHLAGDADGSAKASSDTSKSTSTPTESKKSPKNTSTQSV